MSRRSVVFALLGAAAIAVTLAPGSALAQVSGSAPTVDQVVLRGDVVVARGHVVGEVLVFSGSATVAGVARGDVVVLDGPVTIAGQVGGDVVAIHGEVRVLATAQIAGTVRGGGDVHVADGAQVSGGVERGVRFTLSAPLDVLGPLLASAAMAVSILVAGLVLLVFAPAGAERVSLAGRTSPVACAGWGLVFVLTLPIVAVAAAATVLGLPLGLALVLGIGLFWLVGMAWATFIAGRMLVREPRSRWGALFAGWGIGAAIGLVPFVNAVWWSLGAVFGLGSMIVAAWRARSPRRQPGSDRRQRRERGGRHREGKAATPVEVVIGPPETPLAED